MDYQYATDCLHFQVGGIFDSGNSRPSALGEPRIWGKLMHFIFSCALDVFVKGEFGIREGIPPITGLELTMNI